MVVNNGQMKDEDLARDLGSTCSGNFLDNDYTDCDCAKARKKLADGLIDCNVDKPCPDDYPVCQICLYYVIDECISPRGA